LQVFVRVTPRSARDGVEGVTDGVDGPALKVRVRAITDKGAANRAVETVLADWLGHRQEQRERGRGRQVAAQGAVEVAGEPADLQRLLRARLGDLAD
jgi:uncharacterized protein